MKVRPVFLVIFAVVMVAAVVAFFVVRFRTAKVPTTTAAAPPGGKEFGEPLPAPVPSSLPLSGPVGVDKDGYPTQWIDRPAMQSLLRHHRYAELTTYLTELQDQFEKDPRKEYWITDAVLAFESSNEALDVLFDEWVAASPDSFAPRVARGVHRVSVGWARRGGRAAKDTTNTQVSGMDRAFEDAAADFDAALEKRPKLVVALSQEIRTTYASTRRRSARALVDAADVVCPSCVLPKIVYLLTLRPKWGGSYAKMRAFAAEWNPGINGRLATLAGFADQEECDAELPKRVDLAEAAIGRALATGEAWEFYECRGRVRWHQKNDAGAFADFERANELRPGTPEVLAQRAQLAANLKKYDLAAESLLAAARINVGDWGVTGYWESTHTTLLWESGQRIQAGDTAGALALLDLTWAIQPRASTTLSYRGRAIAGKGSATSATVDELEAAIALHPDDLALHQSLDFALARAGRFDRVIEMWTEFIGRHPDEALAYIERSGAYYHRQRTADMMADKKKACELGWIEGCGGPVR